MEEDVSDGVESGRGAGRNEKEVGGTGFGVGWYGDDRGQV